MEKFLLVDGNSMLFRAYFATAYGRPMSTKQGIPTNAVYGFAMMFQKAIELVKPYAILVAFDAGKHTFRHEIYPDYKGGRKQTPDDLVPQFKMVRDYLDAFGVKWLEIPDIEADDIVGTMAKRYPDYDINILSSDHDLLQLIDPTTSVWLMKKGISDIGEMDEKALKEDMGIVPRQIIDLKGLMGDASDNIPGIPGVGEKTALKLLSEYDNVENVLAHSDELKGKLKEKVEANKELALLSKKLATINTQAPVDLKVEDCIFKPTYSALVSFFNSVDMNSMVAKFNELASGEVTNEAPSSVIKNEVVKTIDPKMLKDKVAIVFDADLNNFMDAKTYGLAISDGKKQFYIDIDDAKKDAAFLKWCTSDNLKIGYDIKRNQHLMNRCDLQVNYTYDTMIAAFLVNSTLTSWDKIKDAYFLNEEIKDEDVYGKPDKPKFPDKQLQIDAACNKAYNLFKIYDATYKELQDDDMDKLFNQVEMPLSKVLYEMEEEGIVCDQEILDGIASTMQKQLSKLTSNIYKEAGKEFNINSPKQLAQILFDDLGLPANKKRSTSVDILEKLQGIHPVIDDLLVYRKLQKLYSTYAEGLKKYIHNDKKIHTIYNQCVSQTGRLSSSEPNLQNITVRDEQGKEIRKAFLPSKGHVLISCDYSQVELRMLAHMADEKALIKAFNDNFDIHTKTAMDVFDVKEDEVTPLMRRQAKAVNFGIVYGISDFGLAEQLGIYRNEAKQYIENYFAKYPRIKEYMNSIIAQCEEQGYVTTILNRRRQIPEIHDKNHMVREFGKRAAMNAPIQGSAADLIKVAMLKIDKMMKEAKVESKMILQVHDELIFDVVLKEKDMMIKLIEEGMNHAMELKVPLVAECKVGNDWYEAK